MRAIHSVLTDDAITFHEVMAGAGAKMHSLERAYYRKSTLARLFFGFKFSCFGRDKPCWQTVNSLPKLLSTAGYVKFKYKINQFCHNRHSNIPRMQAVRKTANQWRYVFHSFIFGVKRDSVDARRDKWGLGSPAPREYVWGKDEGCAFFTCLSRFGWQLGFLWWMKAILSHRWHYCIEDWTPPAPHQACWWALDSRSRDNPSAPPLDQAHFGSGDLI